MTILSPVFLFLVLASTASCISVTSLTLCKFYAPSSPQFGLVEVEAVSKSTNVLMKAKFSCLTGYSLNGSAEIFCDTNGQWSGQIPTCQLKVYDSVAGDCNVTSWKNCVCVNDARNPILWETRTMTRTDNKTINITSYPITATILRCSSNDTNCLKSGRSGDTLSSQISNRRRRQSSSLVSAILRIPENRRKTRSLPVTQTWTRITLGLPLNAQHLIHSSFEVGPFTHSSANNYIHFYVALSGSGVQYYRFDVTAHCLPDPPGHLVLLGAKPYNHFRIDEGGTGKTLSRQRDVCLNLKNTWQCKSKRFSIQSSLSVMINSKSQSPKITVIPKSTSPTLSGCNKADNEA